MMEDFIDYIQQGKVSKITDTLTDQLQSKINSAMEIKKQEIASTMFTGEPSIIDDEPVMEEKKNLDEDKKLKQVVADVLDDWYNVKSNSLIPSSSDTKKLEKLVKQYAKKNKMDHKKLSKAIENGQVENVDIISDLKNINESGESEYIMFKDKSRLKVDDETSKHLLNIYENLNTENQNKFIEVIEKNQHNFLKMADFSVNS
jgi:hypothetical protein